VAVLYHVEAKNRMGRPLCGAFLPPGQQTLYRYQSS